MKPRFLVALAVVLLIGLLPTAAVAQTGTPLLLQAPDPTGLTIADQAKSSEPGAYRSVADNFLVPAGGMTIGQIELWGTYVDANYDCIDATTYTDSFAVFFHPDAGGVPDASWVEGFSDMSPDSRTPTGGTVMGCAEYKFVLKLGPLGLSRTEGTWWIEIYNSGGTAENGGKYFAWEKGGQDANGLSLDNVALWDGTNWMSIPSKWMALGFYSPMPTMVVKDVFVNVKTTRSGSTATGQVVIIDDQGQPVSKALVSVLWTMPDGSTLTQQATTGRNGTATFRGVKDGPGENYTLCVSGVTKAGWVYAPNLFTCPPS